MGIKRFLILYISIISIFLRMYSGERIDLSGEWHYSLLGAPASVPGEGYISLPNTLDNAHKSQYNPKGDDTTQPRREFSFTGESTFSRKVEIPKSWDGKEVILNLERTKPTKVKIDGIDAGYNSRISSPQRYKLSEFLTPGSHTLQITVNNSDSIPPIVARSSHAVSESTQTNWNGILGDIYMEVRNPFNIERVIIEEINRGEGAWISVIFSEPSPAEYRLSLPWKGHSTLIKMINPGDTVTTIFMPISQEESWSGFRPRLHNIDLTLTDTSNREIDRYEFTTGFRDFSTSGTNFTINGEPIFLRGTVNAAVFPLTAYAPTDLQSWKNYFSVLKEYGINHVRFHSWTPPEAAFEAADQTGIYILAELPVWGELDRDLKFHNRFLKEELAGIMESYSHHPSFVMFSTGNELWGDITLMAEYMKEAKELNPRILSTYGSNVYLGMNGQIGEEDFIVASKTGDDISKSVRGSVSYADSPSGGFLNSRYPDSRLNYDKTTEKITVPVISHEVGQYQTYPDFSEIEKYTGALKPDNLEEFRRRAGEAGTLRKNKAYADASGKWAARLYKAEMEAATRSEGIAGFELFGLQDYPGQGTALVGILDPFMDSKGLMTAEEFRQSSSDQMILAEFPKFTFTSGELVNIPLKGANYASGAEGMDKMEWETKFSQGEFPATEGKGLIEIGEIEIRIPEVIQPEKMTLNIKSVDDRISNSYDFWVYPSKLPKVDNVKLTHNLEEALKWLAKGDRVILMPDSATIAKASLDPLFTTDFWNYRMFRTICDEMHLTPSPGTLGLLIDSEHPSLKKFPTGNHTDWQWYPIIKNSRPLIIDRLPKEIDPVVEVIDNVERNFRLALMLECNVGKGKLMIISANLDKASEYPEGKWLLQSVKEYMASKECKPEITLTPAQVKNLLTKPSNARLIKELKNETYNRF